MATLLAGLSVAAIASESAPREFTVIFQNGSDYDGATDDGGGPALKLSMNRRDRLSDSRRLYFGRIGDYVRGDQVEVLDARLELFYSDETWTLIRYDVAAFRPGDRNAHGAAQDAEGRTTIVGDKAPPGTKTPLKSWLSIPIRPVTVEDWLKDETSNTGLLLTIDAANVGPEQEHVELSVSGRPVKGPFVAFGSNDGPKSQRPRLVIRYRVLGNVSPPPPRIAATPGGAMLASPVDLAWDPVADPDPGDEVRYQFQVGSRQGAAIEWAEAATDLVVPSVRWDVSADLRRLYSGSAAASQDQVLWYRLRSVDSRGGASRWVTAGPFHLAGDRWSVWVLDGNRKVWGDSPVPPDAQRRLRIHAARNEWEPFQVAVVAHAALKNLRVMPSMLKGPGGAALKPPTAYREHFIPIEETANTTYGRLGQVPDALVPLVHPDTGRPTAGLYGGDRFQLEAGGREVFWFDTFVPPGTPPGTYRGTVEVTADGIEKAVIEVELEVWDFELPSPKHLVACFQMDEDSAAKSHQLKPNVAGRDAIRRLAHRYEAMLHQHYISNWSPITGFNYGLNGVKVSVRGDVVSTDWSEFDALVGPYMDGSAFEDGVPSQCLFVPYWLPASKKKGDGWAPRVNQFNYETVRYDLFEQFVRQMQDHLEAKGWLDRAYLFYFDEPFISKWKYQAYLETAKAVRRAAPKMKIMLTDGYRGPDGYRDKEYITEPIEPYVDVWNPVTFQVSSPELAAYYRARKRAGKFDMWCQTLANANPRRGVINLFPEFDMPFHRMWGVLSWSLGFQGIEWWQTIVWWDPEQKRRIDPWNEAKAFPGFRQPLNGDGRLFYPGDEHAIGGPDIPISSLRMKAVREAIEDYEYLYLLDQAGAAARFELDSLYTLDSSRADGMISPRPMGKGPWQWWEGDPDAFMKRRTEIARLILEAGKSAPADGR